MSDLRHTRRGRRRGFLAAAALVALVALPAAAPAAGAGPAASATIATSATSATSATRANATPSGATGTSGATPATSPALAHTAPGAEGTGTGAGSDQTQFFNVTLVPTPPPQPAAGAAAAAPRPAARAAGARGGAAEYLWLLPLVLAVAALAARVAWRRRPRHCSDCGAPARRLDGEAAFAQLDMAERTEHLVGDVRYEVFLCAACGRIDKRGTARDLSALAKGAGAPPVGSAAFLRRRTQSGLSIWTPPAVRPAARPGDPRGKGISGGILPPPR